MKLKETAQVEEVKQNLLTFFAAVHEGRSKDEIRSKLAIVSGTQSDEDGLRGCRDGQGQCALHFAAHGGNLETAEWIVEKCEELVSLQDKEGRTPLMIAAQRGNTALCTTLLKRVKNETVVNMCSASHATALHFAVDSGDPSTVDVLLENGAQINAISDTGTAIHRAIVHRRLNLLKSLLSRGGSATLTKPPIPPPLVLASSLPAASEEYQPLEAVKALMDCGASVSVTDAAGWTPLQCAAEVGATDIVKCFLSAGADPSISTMGKTALDLAHDGGHEETALALGGPATRPAPMEMQGEAAKASSRTNLEVIRKKAAELKAGGNKAVSSAQWSKAIKLYTEVLELCEDRVEILDITGVVYANRSYCLLNHKTESLCALTDARKAVQLLPEWGKGYYRLAEAERAAGNWEECAQQMFNAFKMSAAGSAEQEAYSKGFRQAVENAKKRHAENS